jgi:hypothetical protein
MYILSIWLKIPSIWFAKAPKIQMQRMASK